MGLSLREAFDHHASLVIDSWTYQTNPALREVADEVFATAGITSHDVSKAGVTIYHDRATFDVFERTEDGKHVVRDGVCVTRPMSIPVGVFV